MYGQKLGMSLLALLCHSQGEVHVVTFVVCVLTPIKYIFQLRFGFSCICEHAHEFIYSIFFIELRQLLVKYK